MAVTIQDLFNKIPSEDIKFQMVNNTLMGASRSSKKKTASLQIGVEDEIAMNFMGIGGKTDIGMLIIINRDSFEIAKKELGL